MHAPIAVALQELDALLEGIELTAILVNLALTMLMGHVLAWHYMRFAQVLSNKRKFARIFVFLSVTTFLVISVVSNSLALSLGLVGALSIVRFRTPIKEPQELAYLFLAIAVGIGMGANEQVITAIVFVVILAYLTVQSFGGGSNAGLRTVLQVSAPEGNGTLETVLETLRKHCSRVDLRRVDRDAQELSASFLIELDDVQKASTLVGDVRAALPDSSVSLIERDTLV